MFCFVCLFVLILFYCFLFLSIYLNHTGNQSNIRDQTNESNINQGEWHSDDAYQSDDQSGNGNKEDNDQANKDEDDYSGAELQARYY